MPYVDGFVLAVPKKNLDAYKQLARRAGDVWKEYGADDYVECVGDEAAPHAGADVHVERQRGGAAVDAVQCKCH